jgi:hypothetical protein
MPGQVLSKLPDPLGVTLVVGAGVLRAGTVLVAVPEVEDVGDEGVVLGFEEVADEDDEKGKVALAEVLAGRVGALRGAGGG